MSRKRSAVFLLHMTVAD